MTAIGRRRALAGGMGRPVSGARGPGSGGVGLGVGVGTGRRRRDRRGTRGRRWASGWGSASGSGSATAIGDGEADGWLAATEAATRRARARPERTGSQPMTVPITPGRPRPDRRRDPPVASPHGTLCRRAGPPGRATCAGARHAGHRAPARQDSASRPSSRVRLDGHDRPVGLPGDARPDRRPPLPAPSKVTRARAMTVGRRRAGQAATTARRRSPTPAPTPAVVTPHRRRPRRRPRGAGRAPRVQQGGLAQAARRRPSTSTRAASASPTRPTSRSARAASASPAASASRSRWAPSAWPSPREARVSQGFVRRPPRQGRHVRAGHGRHASWPTMSRSGRPSFVGIVARPARRRRGPGAPRLARGAGRSGPCWASCSGSSAAAEPAARRVSWAGCRLGRRDLEVGRDDLDERLARW